MALEGHFTGNIPDPFDDRDLPLFTANEATQILSQRATNVALKPATASAAAVPVPVPAPAAAPTPARQQPPTAPLQPVGPHLQAAAPAKPIVPTPSPSSTPVPPKPQVGTQTAPPPAVTPKPVTGGGGAKPVPVPQPGPVTPGPKPDPQPKPKPLPKPDDSNQPVQPVPEDVDSDPDDLGSPVLDPPWFEADPVDRAGAVILPNLPPVYDQWRVGSCSINASCAALRYAYCKFTGKSYDEFNPSRLYAWYFARISRAPLGVDASGKDLEADPVTDIQSTIKSNDGVHNRGSIHTFLTKGICTEELWPYGRPHVSNGVLSTKKKPNPCEPLDWDKVIWQAQPSAHQGDFKDLTKTGLIPRAISYYRIFDPSVPLDDKEKAKVTPDNWRLAAHPPVELLEHTIDQGFLIIFATMLFNGASLGSLQIRNGVFMKPPPRGVPMRDGNHAMLAVGYHRTRRLMLVQNSWGTNWPTDPGQGEDMKGRFWMPYEWFTDKRAGKQWMTYDFWVIKYSDESKVGTTAQG